MDPLDLSHIPGQQPDVGGFVAVIQFRQDGLAKLIDQTMQVNIFGPVLPPLDPFGQVVHNIEIGLDRHIDVGPLDLNRHSRAVMQDCFVNLGRGGRRKRLFFKGSI